MLEQTKIPRDLSIRFANMGFVCACLVVAYHVGVCGVYPYPGWWIRKVFSEMLGPIAVPYFFLASGFFLSGHISEQGWWRRAISQRVRTLLIPYLIWDFIYGVFRIVLYVGSNIAAGRPLMDSLPDSLWGWLAYVGLNPASSPILGPLWFVRSLMILVVLSPALKWAFEKWRWLFILALYCAYVLVDVFGFVTDAYLRGVLHRALSLQGFCFFSLGMALRMRPLWVLNGGKKVGLWLFGLVVFLTLYSYYHAVGGWSVCPHALFIPLVLLCVWKVMPAHPLNKVLTASSFPMFLLHCFGLETFAYSSRFVHLGGPFSTYLIRLVVCIVCPIGISVVLRHLLPRFSQIAFGGR